MTLIVSPEILDETLATLSSARTVECVTLWLAKNSERNRVAEWFKPDHIARADMFQLTPAGMAELRRKLREGRLFIAAQLHTHPNEAFHSRADDKWALVRHLGAFSIVLPRFAQGTLRENFFDEAAVFEMSSDGRWVEVSAHDLQERLRLG